MKILNSKLLNILVFTRNISTSSLCYEPRALTIMKSRQAQFQCEDGVPVWLKGGPRDRFLYITTWILCGLGMLGTILTLYDNAKPNSWKTASGTC